MATIGNSYWKDVWRQVCQIGSGNTGLSASIQYVQDGGGNSSVLGLSTTAVQVNATSITINGYVVTVNGTAGISGTNTGDQTITLTGDVTGTGTGSFAATIAANTVTYAKFQQVAAVSLVGNATGSTANATGITLSPELGFTGSAVQVVTNGITYSKIQQSSASKLLGNPTGGAANIAEIGLAAELGFTGSNLQIATNGVTYAKIQSVAATSLVGNPTGSPANASAITLNSTLSFTGTTLQREALTGDVTASAGSNSTTIGTNVVTYAKMQQVSANKLLGSTTGSTANIGEVTIGTGLSLSSGTLSTSGGVVSINVQRFTSGSGTYTPTSGTVGIHVILLGAGGGGGGVSNAGAYATATGGTGGSYLEFTMTAAQVGASKSYAVGALGTGGTSGNNNGVAGGDTTFGDWTCKGGPGGAGMAGTTAPQVSAAGTFAVANTVGTGDLILDLKGDVGAAGFTIATPLGLQSRGGPNVLTGFNFTQDGYIVAAGGAAGTASAMTGAGGGGAINVNSSTNRAGGNGAAGIVIVLEYIQS